MANIYYQLFDRSKKSTDIKFAQFGFQPHNTDLAGLVTAMAARNDTSVDNIRLFVYETKRQWESCKHEWSSRVLAEYRRRRSTTLIPSAS